MMRVSFFRQQIPKQIVFMNPPRELGGAQPMAGKPKGLNIFGSRIFFFC